MSPADDWRVETGEGGDGHCSARCILGIHTVNRAGALKVGAAFAQRARFRPFCLASLSGLITSRTDNRAYIMANMPYPPLILLGLPPRCAAALRAWRKRTARKACSS